MSWWGKFRGGCTTLNCDSSAKAPDPAKGKDQAQAKDKDQDQPKEKDQPPQGQPQDSAKDNNAETTKKRWWEEPRGQAKKSKWQQGWQEWGAWKRRRQRRPTRSGQARNRRQP